MSIPSQLPQLVTAARTGALQALALQAGQMLDGKVIGPAPNGGTQVEISGQMLNLVLPLLAKAGETLKFEVQGSGAQLRLALQPATVPSNAPQAPTPVPAQASSLPLPSAEPAASAVPAQPMTQAVASQSWAQAMPQSTSAPPAAVNQPPEGPSPSVEPRPVAGAVQPAATPGATVQVQPAQMPANPMPANPTPANPMPVNPAAVTSAPGPMPAAIPGTVAVPVPVPAALAQPVPGSQAYAPAPPKNAAAPVQPVLAPLAVTPGGVDARGLPPATAAMTQPVATPVPQATAATVPMPSTPQAALTQMVQNALPRQDGVASLTAALTSIAGKVALPEPVLRAAQQVLAGRVDLGKLDAGGLQKAVLGSGVFQEAMLARAGSPPPTVQTDMKSSLLALRQTLTTWLGQQAPLTSAAQIAPPLRGHVPRARTFETTPIDPRAAPEEVGKQLLERTEAALSRVRLHQNASLPEAVAKGAEWSMDVPVLIGQQQALLHLQIHRDQDNGGEAAGERGWQLRFALNLPDMGEVGAQVSLRGQATGVMLWATERATSEGLEANIGTLRVSLAEVGLKPGAILVRHGEPPAPPPAPSGHVVDAST